MHCARSCILKLVLQTRTMKFFILASAVLALAAAASVPSSGNFEDIDMEALLKDDDKTKQAFDCLMDKGPCGEMQVLRDTLPQMIATKCSQCTPKQKENFEKAAKLLQEKRPKEHQALVEKYLPKSE